MRRASGRQGEFPFSHGSQVFHVCCMFVCLLTGGDTGSRRRKVWFQLLSKENYNRYLMSMVRLMYIDDHMYL